MLQQLKNAVHSLSNLRGPARPGPSNEDEPSHFRGDFSPASHLGRIENRIRELGRETQLSLPQIAEVSELTELVEAIYSAWTDAAKDISEKIYSAPLENPSGVYDEVRKLSENEWLLLAPALGSRFSDQVRKLEELANDLETGMSGKFTREDLMRLRSTSGHVEKLTLAIEASESLMSAFDNPAFDRYLEILDFPLSALRTRGERARLKIHPLQYELATELMKMH